MAAKVHERKDEEKRADAATATDGTRWPHCSGFIKGACGLFERFQVISRVLRKSGQRRVSGNVRFVSNQGTVRAHQWEYVEAKRGFV